MRIRLFPRLAAARDEIARLRSEAATCPGHRALHARLASLQAANEAADPPIGSGATPEQWRAAVAAAIAHLTREQQQ